MTSDWTGHRDESLRVDLLDSRDRMVGEMGSVEGGTVEYSIYDRIRSGGKLSLVVGAGEAEPDWLSARVKVWYQCVGRPDQPLGVFLPASPRVARHDGYSTREIELYDKLLVLDQQTTTTAVSFPAGQVVTDALRTVLGWTGETNLAVTDSTEALRSPMTWEPRTPLLTICNDLLDAINYFALWCDGDGKYVAQPYTSPSQRGVAWDFTGRQALYLPDVDEDADYYSVPNRFTAVSTSTPDTAALVAVAEDWTSRFGRTARGRWVDASQDDIETTSADVLQAVADRRLADAQQVTSTDQIDHPWLPVRLNDVVTRDGVRAVVTKQAVSLALPGVLATSTLRRLL